MKPPVFPPSFVSIAESKGITFLPDGKTLGIRGISEQAVKLRGSDKFRAYVKANKQAIIEVLEVMGEPLESLLELGIEADEAIERKEREWEQ